MLASEETVVVMIFIFAVRVSLAAFDMPFLAKRHDPAAGAVWAGELVRGHLMGEAASHELRLCVDCRANEITFDADEDRPQIKSSECFLVCPRNVSVGNRAGTSDDPTDQSIKRARLFHFPDWSGIQKCSGILKIALKSWHIGLLREALERARKFGMTESRD
ncbi:hypothetical protein XH99_00745 [Bradyrhizobium nanningense]|uniref:Uncharacterized protein n=1 Tax=Bradyrhizobium nanningense TaxID=1325118 RepID=A0A4Q0SHH0_9BRAD|nr:hypothetical protein XH99_00745 [Bradyrhizobium nanningense]